MSNGTKGENRSQRFKTADFAFKKLVAIGDFDTDGPIFRRHAANGIGNAATDQGEVIVGFGRVGTLGQSKISQYSV